MPKRVDEDTLNHSGNLPWELKHLWVTEESIPQKDGRLTSLTHCLQETMTVFAFVESGKAAISLILRGGFWERGMLGVLDLWSGQHLNRSWPTSSWPFSIKKMLCLGLKEYHTKSSALRIQAGGTLAQQSTVGSPSEWREAGLAVDRHYWSQGRNSFHSTPLRHRQAAAG